MNAQAPAGWYPQPDGTQRYWDGSQWTEHVAPAAQAAGTSVQPLSATGVAVDEATRPWWKKRRFIIPGAGAVVIGLIVAIGATSRGDGDSPASPQQVAQQATTTPRPATLTMPNVVGMQLQDARDALQALGATNVEQQDASGQGRAQIIDSNWVVCTQTPGVGVDAPVVGQIVLSSVKSDETCPGAEPSPSPSATAVEPPAPTQTPEPALTGEQEQAVGAAQDYLEFEAFSRSGLIDQLKYEGFSKKVATFAVDYLHVNWNKQAVAEAENYLDFESFSKSGLIDQLKYEGFSTKQADYAIAHIDVNWNQQAAKKAKSYLQIEHFSHAGLVEQLMYEGFTKKQAEYGVKKAGL